MDNMPPNPPSKLSRFSHLHSANLIVSVVVVVGVGLFGWMVHERGKPTQDKPDLVKTAQRQTQNLVELDQQLAKSKSSQTQRVFTDAAKTRLDTIKQILDKGQVKEALALAKPDGFPNAPAEATQYLETKATLEGKLHWIHGHQVDKEGKPTSEYDEYHVGPSLDSSRLYLTDEPSEHLPNAIVSVQTLKFGSIFAADDSSITQTAAAPALAALIGTKKVAVLMFNFTNDRSTPFAASDVNQLYFSNTQLTGTFANSIVSVNWEYQHASDGQFGINGNVFGWFQINAANNISCDYTSWSSAADAAAQLAGIDLSSYNNRAYVFPTSNTCGFSGIAELGGTHSWLNGGALNPPRAAHELGHNFGMIHAHGYYGCTSGSVKVPLSDSCSNVSDYGDQYDIMGSGLIFNAFHRSAFGWLTPQTITSSGTYTIDTINSSSGNRALKIHRSGSNYFYVQYDQSICPFGSGSCLNQNSQGVTVRVGEDSLNNVSGNVYTLNMGAAVPGLSAVLQDSTFRYCIEVGGDFPGYVITPYPAGCGGVISGYGQTQSITPYPNGQTFSDDYGSGHSGIKITTLSVTPTTATIKIDIPAQPCVIGPPSATLGPNSISSMPGLAQVYNLSITNQDSSTCGSSTFNLASGTLPNGYTQIASQPSVTLAPGATTTVQVTVNSPIYALKNTSANITEIVTDSSHGATTSTTSTYIIPSTFLFFNCSHC